MYITVSLCSLAFSWLINNSNFTMVYGVYNYSIHGGYLHQLIARGPHLGWSDFMCEFLLKIVIVFKLLLSL